MDNLNLLCQTIRFQRTALQNSLAMITAVQQHGEKFLKSTLDQSPWIPGEGKDACLFWAGIWRKNLTGVSELVDKNLATMERLTSTGERKEMKRTAERPAAEPAPQRQEQPQPSVTAKSATPEKSPSAEKPQPEKKAPPEEAAKEATKEAEQTAMAITEPQKAQVLVPPEKKSEQPQTKQPSEKKKPSEPKA